jgi:hypothetical protein
LQQDLRNKEEFEDHKKKEQDVFGPFGRSDASHELEVKDLIAVPDPMLVCLCVNVCNI